MVNAPGLGYIAGGLNADVQMDTTFIEFLSLRTFSSVWYWIAVAFVWISVTNRPMGIPYDMVWRAERQGDAARTALDAVAGALARRLVAATGHGAMVGVGIISAVLTLLLILALSYGSELAQGCILVAGPMTVVTWLNLRTARAIVRGDDPVRRLRRLRAIISVIAVLTLFVTAFWGMYVNLMSAVL